MKRWKGLYESVCSFENLFVSSRRARRGKRRHPEVCAFELKLEENLTALREELLEQRWQPGPYREFQIHEAKPRRISAAPYRDRVVHHALCRVIEPLFDRTFIFDSYACRPGKGTHAAADRCTAFSRRARYVLQCDIARYFSSIRHDRLFERLARKIGDRDTLWLCDRILRTHGSEGLLWPSGRGLPLGNLTSQFFANVYLNGFDHWMKEVAGARYYLRYVDDFLVLSDDKRGLREFIPHIEERLSELGLRLHERKRTVVPVSEGIDFMGYRNWPDHRRLRPSNGYRAQRRLRRLSAAYERGACGLDRVRASVHGWIGHARHADTWGLRRAVLETVAFSRG